MNFRVTTCQINALLALAAALIREDTAGWLAVSVGWLIMARLISTESDTP